MRVQKFWSFFLLAAMACLVGVARPDTGRAAEASCPDILPSAWIDDKSLTGMNSIVLGRGDLADVYFPAPPANVRPSFEDAFPVVAMLQGAGVDKRFYMEFGRQLARHGFVVVIPNHFQAFPPGSPPILLPDQNVVLDVLAQMEAEDANPGSPLSGIVDTTRMGLAGHSFGGVVSLFALEGSCNPPFCFGPPFFPLPSAVQAGAFSGTNTFNPSPPFQLIDVNTDGIPVALVQGSLDSLATPAEAQATFDILDGPKALIPIEGANHYGICDINNPPDTLPDLVPPSIPQSQSVQEIAWSIGEFFSTYVKGDPTDADGDGIPNTEDNCPIIPNPDQTDVNNDGFGDICVSRYASIADGVELGCGVIIGDRVRIQQDAEIGDLVQIGDWAKIYEGAVVGPDSVIGSDSKLEQNVSLGQGTRLGSNVRIYKRAVVGPDSVIGSDSKLGQDVSLGQGTRLGSNVRLDKDVTTGGNFGAGDGTLIKQAVIAEDNVSIGDRTKVEKNTSLGSDTSIGTDGTIRENVQIGQRVRVGHRVAVKKKAVIPDDTVIPDGASVN